MKLNKPEKASVIHSGIKLGLGSSYHIYNEEYFNGKSIFSYNLGIYINATFSKFLYMQTELNYFSGGSDNSLGTLRTHCINVPLNFYISSNKYEEVSAFLLLGGYYDYCFNGKIGSSNLNIGTDYSRRSYGLNYGFGIKIKKVGIELVNKRGLSNVLINYPNGSVFEKSFLVAVSIDIWE